jgi:hypothetical protein
MSSKIFICVATIDNHYSLELPVFFPASGSECASKKDFSVSRKKEKYRSLSSMATVSVDTQFIWHSCWNKSVTIT